MHPPFPVLTITPGNEALLAIMALFLALGLYFFNAYVHYRIFQKARYDRTWVAFLPFGTLYGKLEVLKKPRSLLLLPLLGYGASAALMMHYGGLPSSFLRIDVFLFYLGTVLTVYLNWLLLHRFRLPPPLALLWLLPQGMPFLMLIFALLAFRRRYRFHPKSPPTPCPPKE